MAKQWLEELYKDAERWQLEGAYFDASLADLTNDVDCSPSTLKARTDQLLYLAEKIGEDRADELDELALEVAAVIGHSSGTQFKVW